jgi:TonB family protein
MLKKYLTILIILLANCFSAQLSSEEFEASAIGGKDEVEQVIQTQLTLPKLLLTSGFDEHVTCTFDLDSVGNAMNISFKSGYNNALRKETTRLLRFLKFRNTQNTQYETYPYSFTYHISTARYAKFIKQRSKLIFKKPLAADSSYIIYSRAERAPEYYKNGEDGLAEFVLSEIEYPKVAIEKSIEGTVVVEFIVETNGYVTGVTAKQGVNAGCTEEAIRIIKMTKWLPATFNSKYVRYKNTYPITFSLRNINRENDSASQTIGQ